MNIQAIFKVFSNPLRIRILTWLKDPELYFPPMTHLPKEEEGKGYVCVSAIQEKVGINQSTASYYLNMMKQAELLSCKRIGQWTYYRRNEETIKKTAQYIAEKL